jgi:hypothetical protein
MGGSQRPSGLMGGGVVRCHAREADVLGNAYDAAVHRAIHAMSDPWTDEVVA